MLVSRLEKWQQTIRSLNDTSRFGMEESDRDVYLELSREAVCDVLVNMKQSRYMSADPTGERALVAAAAIRKNLRLLYRSGKINKNDAFVQLDELSGKLRGAICDQDQLREILAKV
jgi:hypothetical protein